MARMVIHPKTGQKLVTPQEAAAMYGCSLSHLRTLRIAGDLRGYKNSPRSILYFADEVARVAKEKAELRKKRGGHPRKDESAA